MLKSAHIKHKVKFLVFTKIVTFIFLSCTYQYNQYEVIYIIYKYLNNSISESLENGRKFNISLDIRTHRTLAKYENKNDLINAKLQYKTDNNRDNHKLLYRRENNNTYQHIKNSTSNNVESYLKLYNKRYSKKKGLKKFDCYYEKKLYNSLNKLEKLAKKKETSKSRIISIICGKYGLPLILLSLIPLLVYTFPKIIAGKEHSDKIDKCKFTTKSDNKEVLETINHDNCKFNEIEDFKFVYIFIFISFFIVLSIIIYTYIKILKYKRIKEGMLK
ncbi:Plasmodium exported protein, unknown function [Plasmodium vivax]|uniref:Fam-l protein n=1 Tax=Plasmodium vivax TaxID=5855 RepID=A0A1G4E9S7_PLAVI|nr:Plasmodium exported protein, unknown function [Plasmodium vivax]